MKIKGLEKILKSIPLSTRLNIVNEMMFIDLLTELGYREDTMWTILEDETLDKLCKLAKQLTKLQIREMEQWKLDGCP